MRARSIATIEPLLAALERANLAPTVARNYEQFPDFGHDVDLVLNGGERHATPVLTQVARNLGWDYLTVCTHYQNVVAYRFHHMDPPETLHVDVIHSLTLWGQTLCTARELCDSRIPDPSGRFWRLAGPWENGYRLFQIESLLRATIHDPAKIERYRQRVLAFDARAGQALADWGGERGMPGVEAAIEALRVPDFASFRASIHRAKRGFLLARVRRNGPRVAVAAIRRTWWRGMESHLAPCGPAFKLNAGDQAHWEPVLDSLVQTGFILGWGTSRRWRERQFAHVKFAFAGDVFEDPYSSFQSVARQIVERHSVAYAKPNQTGRT